MLPEVRLIAATKPVIPEAGSNAGEFVAYVARVSNPGNQNNHDTSQRLLAYLRRNRHWSPFEMADAVVEVVTTRDIARQMLRHTSFRFQEFSQRYAEATDTSPPKEARLQDDKNRQNSIEISVDDELAVWWEEAQKSVSDRSRDVYEEAIARGLAKEVARVVLLEGLTVSRIYMKGSFRSWTHYLEVRRDPSTQKEHREVADTIHAVLAQNFPEVFGET